MMLADTFHAFVLNPPMSGGVSFLLHVAISGFIVAAVLAVLSQLTPRVHLKWANLVGTGSTIALAAGFALRFIEAGARPLSNMFEIVALCGLGLAVAYLVAARIKPMPAVGAFAFPTLAVLFAVDYLLAPSFVRPGDHGPREPILVVHVVLIVLSYGVFLLATTAAVMSLIQERQLKQHRDTPFIRSFPPLESLRKLVSTCLLVGLPLLTVSFILGFALRPVEDWGTFFANPNIVSGLVLWVVLAAAQIGRATGRLHGRSQLYLVLAGFLLMVLSLVGLGIFAGARANARSMAATLAQEAPCSA